MTNRPAPDVDQLMWVIAESRDMKAVEEFEGRFPELRLELAKRVAMVNGLRSAREESPPIPRFRAPVPQRSIWQRPMALALGAALMVALALGAYTGTRGWLTSRADGEEPAPARPMPVPQPMVPAPQPDGTSNAPVATMPPLGQANPAPIEDLRPYQRPHSVRLENASLLSVLEAIAMQTGLNLEVAPGMPDFSVTVRYESLTGLQMLEDLGRRYQFTALDQGGNRVLIVPVVEPGAGGREDLVPTKRGG